MSSTVSKTRAARTIGVGILLAGGLMAASRMRTGSVAGAAVGDDSSTQVTAISYPSDQSKPPFFSPGIIASIAVKEGDRVKKGDLLMTEDDELEKDELQSDQVESESGNTIKYAEDDHASKVVELNRLQDAANKGVANMSELEEAISAEKTTADRIELAKEERQQKIYQTAKQAAKVARMELRSPIDGIVETINLHLGSGVDPAKPDGACVIVTNDPLWVEMRLPSAQAMALTKGQKLDVRYGPSDSWKQGTIIFFNPVVDAASDTQVVRMELANPEQKPSGLHMTVRLPDNVAMLNVNH